MVAWLTIEPDPLPLVAVLAHHLRRTEPDFVLEIRSTLHSLRAMTSFSESSHCPQCAAPKSTPAFPTFSPRLCGIGAGIRVGRVFSIARINVK